MEKNKTIGELMEEMRQKAGAKEYGEPPKILSRLWFQILRIISFSQKRNG